MECLSKSHKDRVLIKVSRGAGKLDTPGEARNRSEPGMLGARGAGSVAFHRIAKRIGAVNRLHQRRKVASRQQSRCFGARTFPVRQGPDLLADRSSAQLARQEKQSTAPIGVIQVPCGF